MNKRKRPTTDFPKTMERIGLTPPDTTFNRRAAEYAKRKVKKL